MHVEAELVGTRHLLQAADARQAQRRRHPPSRSTIVGQPRKRSTKLDWRVFATPMRRRQGAPIGWVSIWSNCWACTAFCCTASSPRSPTDERIRYGGSLANRMRYPLEVAAAIREVWPRRKALGMRITVTDWVDGGITPDEAGIFAGKLSDIGFDYVCVSSGGISPAARPAIAPGYQVPLAAAVKKASGIAVQAVGMIVDPHQAEAIVADGHADCVALARGFSTTRAGPGMPPLRSAPMPSTRRSTCAPARNIGRVRRLLAIDRRGNAAKPRTCEAQ